MALINTLAISLYLVSTTVIIKSLASEDFKFVFWSLPGILSLMAIVAHGLSVYPYLFFNIGINLDVYTTGSLVSLIIATFVFLGSKSRVISPMSFIVFPFCALMIALPLIFSTGMPVEYGLITSFHIALSLLAYSLFTVGAIQAFFIWLAEERLKRRRPIMTLLPPLPIMENLLFRATGLAFALLTGGILVGLSEIESIEEQLLSHKVIFSLLAWATFLTLLCGRLFFNWRGRKAVHLVGIGFVFLASGFFGSKFFLEVILTR